MAGTLVVGRVAVRVWPDTRLFKEDLEAQLKEKTSRTDAKVPVEAELQAEELEAELEEKVKRLSRIRIALRAQVKGLNKDVLAATKAAEDLSRTDPITFSANLSRMDMNKLMERGIKEAIGRQIATEVNRALSKGMKVDTKALRKLEHQVQWGLSDVTMRPKLGKDFLGQARKARETVQHEAEKVSWVDPKKFERDVLTRIGGKTVTVPVKFNGSDKDFRKQYKKVVNDSIRDTNKTAPGMLGKTFGRMVGNPIKEAVRNAGFHLRGLLNDTKSVIKADVDEVSLAKSEAELELWFKRLKIHTVQIKTILDKESVKGVTTGLAALSGGRLFKNLVSLEPFKHLDEQIPKIAVMAALLGQASNYLISMSSDALALGGSVAQIGMGAVALPGLFAGAFESLIVLTTAMTTASKEAPQLAKQWSALQATIGKNFWTHASKPVSTFLSDMSGGFKKTASSLGGFTSKMLGSFHEIVSPHLPKYVDALGKGFQIVGKSSPAIAHIVKVFGDLGAKATPRLAQWVADMTEKFSAWMKLKGDAGLTQMLDTAITRLKELWSVGNGAWKIMRGLSRAATNAGGATLKSLGDSLQRIAEIVHGAGFQKRLTNVFASARMGIENMVSVSGPAVSKMFRDIGDNAQKLLPKIGTVAGLFVSAFATIVDQPAVGNSLVNFFDSLGDSLRKLKPFTTDVSNGIAGIINVLSSMLRDFEPIVAIALGALESHAQGLLKSVTVIIDNLSSGLAQFMTDLLPAIDQLAPALLSILENASANIRGILVMAGPIVASFLKLVAGLAASFAAIPGPLQGILTAALAIKLAMGGWKGLLATALVQVRAIGAAMNEAFAGSAIASFGGKLKGFGLKMAAALGLAVTASVLLGGLVAGIVSKFQTAVPQVEEFAAALKLCTADGNMTALDDLAKGVAWVGDAYDQNGKKLGEFAKMSKWYITEVHNGWSGLHDGIQGAGDFFTAGNLKGNWHRVKEYFGNLDQYLTKLSSTDMSMAQRQFETISKQLTAQGWSVADLKNMFPEYSAAAQQAAADAAKATVKSTEQIKAEAEEAKRAFVDTQNTMDRQYQLVGSKNAAAIAKSAAKSRATLIAAMRKSVTDGTPDAEILDQAKKLNSKIAKKAEELGKTQNKGAQKKLRAELDTLWQEYQTKFGGDLTSLLTGSGGEGDVSSILSALVGNGLTPEAQSTIQSSITAPINTAVDDAKIKLITLPDTISGMDMTGQVNAKVAEAQTAITTGSATIAGSLAGVLTSFAVTAASLAASAVGALKALTSASFGEVLTGMSGYVVAFSTQSSVVQGLSRTLQDQVRSNVKFSLSAEGTSVVQSFVNGATSQSSLTKVANAAKLIGKTFKDNKGPLSYDRVMLVPEGKATIAGYIDGIMSQVNSVKKAAKTVSNTAASEFGSAADRAINAASMSSSIDRLALSTNQTVYQIGDVTVDVKELEGIKTVDDLAKTLRRKKRQAGGK